MANCKRDSHDSSPDLDSLPPLSPAGSSNMFTASEVNDDSDSDYPETSKEAAEKSEQGHLLNGNLDEVSNTTIILIG